MTTRRLSQAISEGDGISVVVVVDGPEGARAAAEAGADAVLVSAEAAARTAAIRAATELPLVVTIGDGGEVPDGADACVVSIREGDHHRADEVRMLASDTCELAIRIEREDDLEFVLEELDPEVVVLGGAPGGDAKSVVDVLDLLPDVPAGKLAIADVAASTRSEVEELERAGVDAVLVAAGNVDALVQDGPPDV